MAKFLVSIEEHLVNTWEVEAADFEQAEDIAKEKYRSGEFTLTKDDKTVQLMQLDNSSDNTATEWFEF